MTMSRELSSRRFSCSPVDEAASPKPDGRVDSGNQGEATDSFALCVAHAVHNCDADNDHRVGDDHVHERHTAETVLRSANVHLSTVDGYRITRTVSSFVAVVAAIKIALSPNNIDGTIVHKRYERRLNFLYLIHNSPVFVLQLLLVLLHEVLG